MILVFCDPHTPTSSLWHFSSSIFVVLRLAQLLLLLSSYHWNHIFGSQNPLMIFCHYWQIFARYLLYLRYFSRFYNLTHFPACPTSPFFFIIFLFTFLTRTESTFKTPSQIYYQYFIILSGVILLFSISFVFFLLCSCRSFVISVLPWLFSVQTRIFHSSSTNSSYFPFFLFYWNVQILYWLYFLTSSEINLFFLAVLFFHNTKRKENLHSYFFGGGKRGETYSFLC